MSKSPGHQKWPQHKVREHPVGQRLQVIIGDEVLAESDDVIRLEEDDHPTRYYFPRDSVKMDKLEGSDTTSECPFKGTARYFNISADAGGKKFEDVVWSYEDPYDEHQDLKGRLAFYDDKVPELDIRPQS